MSPTISSGTSPAGNSSRVFVALAITVKSPFAPRATAMRGAGHGPAGMLSGLISRMPRPLEFWVGIMAFARSCTACHPQYLDTGQGALDGA